MNDHRHDWLTELGLVVAALAAVVSSGVALAGLARLAGWPPWLAVMLPATMDLYAITATRVWLSRRTTSQAVRRYAAANALTGIAASITGNAVYHGIVAGAVSVPRWLLVVVVSTVPPIVIGALAHLTALRRRESEPRGTRQTKTRATSGAKRTAGAPARTAVPGPRAPVGTATSQEPGAGRSSSVRAAGRRTVDPAALGEAVELYRASVAAGEPLSERRLAERYGLSRRQARKAIAVTSDGDDPRACVSDTGVQPAASSGVGETEEVA